MDPLVSEDGGLGLLRASGVPGVLFLLVVVGEDVAGLGVLDNHQT